LFFSVEAVIGAKRLGGILSARRIVVPGERIWAMISEDPLPEQRRETHRTRWDMLRNTAPDNQGINASQLAHSFELDRLPLL
jgi:hypothetical protein